MRRGWCLGLQPAAGSWLVRSPLARSSATVGGARWVPSVVKPPGVQPCSVPTLHPAAGQQQPAAHTRRRRRRAGGQQALPPQSRWSL